MEQNAKQQRQRYKKEAAVKNFRYNRYLLLRYMLALFFFCQFVLGARSCVSWQDNSSFTRIFDCI